jgi:4'-phosphopantetheinyl transferase
MSPGGALVLRSPSTWIKQVMLPREFSVQGIDVLRVHLRQPRSLLACCRRCLSKDEQDRAEWFAVESARDKFIVARAALRTILGLYVNRAPEELQFAYGPFGKPFLAPDFSTRAVRFNLSHSGDIALVAVTADRDVGIDVELIRELPRPFPMVNALFSCTERNWVMGLPAPERAHAFFLLWTRKEAFLKALGHGVSSGLNELDLLSASSIHFPHTSPAVEPRPGSRWLIFDLPFHAAYQAAVAIEEGNC